jgi:putative hydrolase of the HAD superfamily
MPIKHLNDTTSAKAFFNKPRAVLLDLDDTIIVDDAVSEKSWRAVCNRFAPLVGRIGVGELYSSIKSSSDAYWGDTANHRQGRLDLYQARREVVIMAFSNLGLGTANMAIEIADAFSAEKDRLITLVPGAMEILHLLKNSGLRMALITNGSSLVQRRKIQRFQLESFFDFILIEGEMGMGKPDERVFQEALTKLKVNAPEAWMVGDDLIRDISGAQKLGIWSIWVDWREAGLPQTASIFPNCIIKSLSQLSEIYTDWCKY